MDQKSLETVFSIAFCRPTGDKWPSKTLFLTIFDISSSIVLTLIISMNVDLKSLETEFSTLVCLCMGVSLFVCFLMPLFCGALGWSLIVATVPSRAH